jgi:uncharacterized membrane protein
LNWESIRYRKPSAIAAAVPTVIAFVVAITFIVTVGVFLTGTGWVRAAVRRKSRLKLSLTDQKLAESCVDFDFRPASMKAGNKG